MNWFTRNFETINKITKIIAVPAFIMGALTFWDIWCMLHYGLAVQTGDPAPQDFLNINPLWHFREFIGN